MWLDMARRLFGEMMWGWSWYVLRISKKKNLAQSIPSSAPALQLRARGKEHAEPLAKFRD
jgi:hypothetical protein